jgi:hypothetical protein
VRRVIAALAGAFAVSAALGAVMTACFHDDCTCPPIPPRPAAQGPLPGLEVAGYDSRGERAELPVKPESGTLEVTGDTVVIVYRQAGVEHRVVYQVVDPT